MLLRLASPASTRFLILHIISYLYLRDEVYLLLLNSTYFSWRLSLQLIMRCWFRSFLSGRQPPGAFRLPNHTHLPLYFYSGVSFFNKISAAQLTHLSWGSASGGCANCVQLLYEDMKRLALQWATSYLNREAISIIRKITYVHAQTLTNP